MITATHIRKPARKSLQGKWGKAVLITLVFNAFELLLRLFCNVLQVIPSLYSLVSIGLYVITIPINFGLMVSFIRLKRGEDVSVLDFLTIGFSYFSRAWGIALRTFLALIVPIVLVIVSTFGLSIVVSLSLGNNLISTTNIEAIKTETYKQYDQAYKDYMENPNEDTEYKLQTAQATVEALEVFNNMPTTINYEFLKILIVPLSLLLLFSYIYLYIKSLLYALSIYIAYDNPQLTAKESVRKSKSLMKGNRGSYFILGLSFIGWAILSILTLGIGILWLFPYMTISLICFYEYLSNNN